MTNAIILATPEQIEQTRAVVSTLPPVISDDASAQLTRNWLTCCQTELANRTADRQERSRPHLDALETIRAEYRAEDNWLDATITLLKSRLGHYELACQQLQREAFARAAQAHEAGDHIAARVEIATSNELARSGAPPGVSVREVWRAEIVDASLVPREWCAPDEKRINAVAKATAANDNPPPIAGVRYVKGAIVANKRKGTSK